MVIKDKHTPYYFEGSHTEGFHCVIELYGRDFPRVTIDTLCLHLAFYTSYILSHIHYIPGYKIVAGVTPFDGDV